MSGRHEYPDPTPVELPLNFRRPLTLQEEMQRLIRVEMSRQAVSEGFESFEEANDFDMDEDEDPFTQYEVMDMQPEGKEETLDGKADASGDASGKSVSESGGKDVSKESGEVGKPESKGSVEEGRGSGSGGEK